MTGVGGLNITVASKYFKIYLKQESIVYIEMLFKWLA